MAFNTRNRSGSVQLDDIKELLTGLEKRLTLRISKVTERLDKLEKSVESIQTNQVLNDHEIGGIKKIIVKQQQFIEKIEQEKRIKNVVIQGIPEASLSIEGEDLDDDEEKVTYLFEVMNPHKEIGAIESSFRIGRETEGKPRKLIVKFKEKEDSNTFLFNQRQLRSSELCKKHFGLIYVNKDSSFFDEERRKEAT